MTSTEPTTDALAQRIVDAALGTVDLFSIYLGDRLGWYRSLAADGPASAAELTSRTATDPRYTREWLEQQAVTGLLTVDDGDPPRFTLPPVGIEVLTDEQSLSYLAPLARMFFAVAQQGPALLEAYRTGGGVSWDEFGADGRESQADMNRPWFTLELAGALRSVADLDAQLRAPGVRLADIGCGAGWSTIALAKAYPEATVHGFDIDAPSITLARDNAQKEPDLVDRVTFTHADAAALPASEYTAAFAFECIHDMPQPVAVLDAVRRSLTPGAPMIVMDEAVADVFTAPGDELERLMYGFSLGVCLPDGMSHQPSVATGTVMRASTLRTYALQAGFTDLEVLPIEDFGFWRFYRLHQ
jgi:SAM-dependent methyltransferase